MIMLSRMTMTVSQSSMKRITDLEVLVLIVKNNTLNEGSRWLVEGNTHAVGTNVFGGLLPLLSTGEIENCEVWNE